ncbi:RidA family protein [Pigmentiphaga daeguensis]|jgi:2-iminobutanoate/2-iminopropanoate deaminase|uniref:RidA family protein n=2 Tax=Alcaligenaceae TaxID=506 RepID=A0ABN1BWR7_9BURK
MSDAVAKPKAPLSHAVVAGDFVFVSGTTPFDANRELAPTFSEQMHQVMKNLRQILGECDSSLDKVVKANVILTDISRFNEMNEIYRGYFQEGKFPARTTIEAPLAIAGMMLEIEVVATR